MIKNDNNYTLKQLVCLRGSIHSLYCLVFTLVLLLSRLVLVLFLLDVEIVISAISSIIIDIIFLSSRALTGVLTAIFLMMIGNDYMSWFREYKIVNDITS